MSSPFEVRQGNALDLLTKVPDGAARCSVTSIPYWALRDYGTEPVEWPEVTYSPMPGIPPITIPAMICSLGLEPTPQAFVGHIVLIYREVNRATADDGTAWVNVGDCYAATRNGRNCKLASVADVTGRTFTSKPLSSIAGGFKAKNLVGQSWMVAFALQADGWWLRRDVIWRKPNPMPDPGSRQRPGTQHEYFFMLTKNAKYFYDVDAVRVRNGRESSPEEYERAKGTNAGADADRMGAGNRKRSPTKTHPRGVALRSVWTVPTCAGTGAEYGVAHTATFPPKLILPCIKASSEPGDLVLDPFSGLATTGVVACSLGRRYLGLELSEDYARASIKRLHREVGTPEGRAAQLAEYQDQQIEGQGFLLGPKAVNS